MMEATASRTVTIVNPQGLHARPADMFVKLANRFSSTVSVRKGHETVDGKSILSILTLGAEEGTQLEITATGQDADAALAALCELVDQGFELNEPSEANNSPWL